MIFISRWKREANSETPSLFLVEARWKSASCFSHPPESEMESRFSLLASTRKQDGISLLASTRNRDGISLLAFIITIAWACNGAAANIGRRANNEIGVALWLCTWPATQSQASLCTSNKLFNEKWQVPIYPSPKLYYVDDRFAEHANQKTHTRLRLRGASG